MAYLRMGKLLPSGERSKSFVFGDPDGLINIYKEARIPYSDVKDMFRDYDRERFRYELGKRLILEDEELEYVCGMLFDEKERGEWD